MNIQSTLSWLILPLCWFAQLASAMTTTDSIAVFDMDGKQVIQDEDHVGIVNGKLTAGINYRDVGGLVGLWSPPYVSSNFMLDARVNGEKVPTSKWTWRPSPMNQWSGPKPRRW